MEISVKLWNDLTFAAGDSAAGHELLDQLLIPRNTDLGESYTLAGRIMMLGRRAGHLITEEDLNRQGLNNVARYGR
jgi:hypothetical protein